MRTTIFAVIAATLLFGVDVGPLAGGLGFLGLVVAVGCLLCGQERWAQKLALPSLVLLGLSHVWTSYARKAAQAQNTRSDDFLTTIHLANISSNWRILQIFLTLAFLGVVLLVIARLRRLIPPPARAARPQHRERAEVVELDPEQPSRPAQANLSEDDLHLFRENGHGRR